MAPWLIGRDARHIEAVSHCLMTPYLGFNSSGAEVRAASAIDIALWDLAGQRQGVPTYIAMGGGVRDRIRAYNTCAGYAYNASGTAWRDIGASDVSVGPYDDQVAFMRDAGALAESLLAADAIDFVMLDLAWCGGMTEGRKIATLAEAHAARRHGDGAGGARHRNAASAADPSA